MNDLDWWGILVILVVLAVIVAWVIVTVSPTSP